MADVTINDLTQLTSVDRAADFVEIADASDSYNSKKSSVNNLLNITGAPVGTTDSQTLTNKTLTAPTTSDPVLSGTVTGTYTLGGTPTFPSAVVTLTGNQTLTNKVLTSPTINTATIVNPTITVDTISEYTAANGVTVDGLNIKDSKLNTADSVPNSALSNTGVFSSAWAWQSWTPTFVNWTIGTGGSAGTTASYIQIGKTVFWKVKTVLGSSGQSVGSGVTMTLPVTTASFYATQYAHPLGTARLLDANSTDMVGIINWNTSTTVEIGAIGSAGSYANMSGITSTAPFTWAAGDGIYAEGVYEAA